MGVMRLGDVATILSKLDPHDIERIVWEPYHEEGPGRPPRNPLGVFKAPMFKRLRRILPDREICRRMWNGPMLRMICDIEEREKPDRARRDIFPQRPIYLIKIEKVGSRVNPSGS
jgi:hypothetical protein